MFNLNVTRKLKWFNMYKYIKPSVWALNDYKALPKYVYYISSKEQ